jgi:hypothetical protein
VAANLLPAAPEPDPGGDGGTEERYGPGGEAAAQDLQTAPEGADSQVGTEEE